jgi:hypothetical protein
MSAVHENSCGLIELGFGVPEWLRFVDVDVEAESW